MLTQRGRALPALARGLGRSIDLLKGEVSLAAHPYLNPPSMPWLGPEVSPIAR